MNVAGWYITHHNAALKTKIRLTFFALIGCTLFNWVSCIADRRRQLSCVGEGVYSDATQVNSTRRRVELRRYKRALREHLCARRPFIMLNKHQADNELERHSVERMYLRLAVNKTILKPPLAAATGAQYLYVGFSRRNNIQRCRAYDIGEIVI